MARSKTTTVGLVEAKKRLPELIERVTAGESVTITRHGAPVARLVRYGPGADHEKVRGSIDGLRKLRKTMRLRGMKIRNLIDEGRS
jgi:prevent-host-death family protein